MNVTLFLEIKNEYTEHLIDILTPFIFEGLLSYYKEAVDISEDTKNNDRILLIFQKMLQSIDGWSQTKIEEETNRIKQMSGTSEYLDDLVKGVIKSNIILLTYSNNVSNVIAQTFYNSVSTPGLIHRCYIECAKDAHNNPFLFLHCVSPMDIKRNQIIIEKNIQLAITRGIRKILPIGLILKEYLVNSVNIIYEPPNVELVGHNPRDVTRNELLPATGGAVAAVTNTLPIVNPPAASHTLHVAIPENGIKSDKLEKKVLNMIGSEYAKSDKDKVKALMQLEKVLDTAEQKNKLAKQEGGKDKVKDHHKDKDKEKIKPVVSKLLESPNAWGGYTPNKKLSKSDKAVININFDSESTAEDTSSKQSGSVTSISEKPHTKHIDKNRKHKRESTENSDKKKAAYIEEYGYSTEVLEKNHRKHK